MTSQNQQAISDDERNVVLQMMVTWEDRLKDIPKEQDKLLDQLQALRQEEKDTRLAISAFKTMLGLAGVDVTVKEEKKE